MVVAAIDRGIMLRGDRGKRVLCSRDLPRAELGRHAHQVSLLDHPETRELLAVLALERPDQRGAEADQRARERLRVLDQVGEAVWRQTAARRTQDVLERETRCSHPR